MILTVENRSTKRYTNFDAATFCTTNLTATGLASNTSLPASEAVN